MMVYVETGPMFTVLLVEKVVQRNGLGPTQQDRLSTEVCGSPRVVLDQTVGREFRTVVDQGSSPPPPGLLLQVAVVGQSWGLVVTRRAGQPGVFPLRRVGGLPRWHGLGAGLIGPRLSPLVAQLLAENEGVV